jgi:uncharacterized protein YyaL (SSP411 family)
VDVQKLENVSSHTEELITMSSEIRWENGMEAALSRAKQEDKPILLDFYNPG